MELIAKFDPEDTGFRGDPDRLQQVVANLLSNAIKFTPRGGRVEVELRRAGDEVELVVTDTGIGIDADFLPHVFDRFRQADSSITRTQGGLGLGLAIVRHLVEVHGGSVRAESEGEGKGARFTVRLPVLAEGAESSDARAGESAGAQSAPAGSTEDGAPPDLLIGLDVLVVDDDADARELVAAVLHNHGASVRIASSVEDGVAEIRRQRPDVLLSDIGLPSADGYALIRRVREIDPQLPAAALTAYATIEDHRRALAAGFQIHITKPVEPADLARLVASLAGRPTQAGPARADEQPRHAAGA